MMRKIPTLFVRDYEKRTLTSEVTPGCEWVIEGKGIATVKFDGTCCLYRDGKLYRRYDAKQGKTPPPNFEPAQPDPDPVTGHWPGWIPVGDGPQDQYHREALDHRYVFYDNWTYELVGPKVQGNPHDLDDHRLWTHGGEISSGLTPPRDFDGLRQWLTENAVEGIVWWRDKDDVDCDKVKIKRKDFGLPWPPKKEAR